MNIKKIVLEFLRRGLVSCGFGPLVLVVVYLILQYQCDVYTLTVNEICLGIVSLSVLAFIAGGMNVIYQIERLPLMVAILIHGATLYISYMGTYLINSWLELGTTPILIFSVFFVFGYLAIWVIIYSIMKRNTKKLNEKLKQKQKCT